MKIIPLSEGSFTVDQTKSFIPFNKEQESMKDRTSGSLLVEIQPFVIVTSTDVILLDTGLGYELNGTMQLHLNLINSGIEPDTVTKVILSHLHKDHSGGISFNNALSFPHAEYYVSRKEYEFANGKESASYNKEDFKLLNGFNKLHLLEGDSGHIDPNITYEVSGGHSPYHTVFWIKEDNEIIFFGGDVAPQLQQMKSRIVAKYDYDGKRSMELRSSWWEKGEQENWTFLFYHDIKKPYVKR